MMPVKKSAAYFTVELAGGCEYRFPEVFRVTDLHPCTQDAFPQLSRKTDLLLHQK